MPEFISNKIVANAASSVFPDGIGGSGKDILGLGAEAPGRAPKIMRYPHNIGGDVSPFMMFHAHRAFYDVDGSGGGIKTNVENHVALYLPIGFQTRDSMSYKDEQSGLAGGMYKEMKSGTSGSIKKNMKDTLSAAGTSELGKNLATGGVAALGHKSGGLAAMILGGSLIGGAISGVVDEIKKETQTVLNENPFITFSGTGLRSFSFTYLMVPESEGEVKSIYDIILFFREHMYPAKVGEMALSFPNVFGIEFKNVAYPKMPECALTDVEITYNKNSASFFIGPEGYPVQVDMTLSFKELMPIYKQHIRKGF